MEELGEKPTMGKLNRLGIRHIQAVLCFLVLTIALAMRTNLSVGIVAMTDDTSNPDFETFDWDEATRGMILSSFFWGYVITQIPSSFIAHKFGAKFVLLVSMLGASISTLVVPAIAPLGWGYMCAFRVLNGIFQGCMYPSLYTLMAKWIHPSERALSAIILTGNQFGIFLMMIVSGEIAASPLGWPGVFYIPGGIGIVWCILWLFLGSESPSRFKWITDEERLYLQESSGTTSREGLPIPWKDILMSMPFWCLIIVHSTQNWGYYTLLTEIPSYMKDILNYDIKLNAVLSAIPYLVLVILSVMSAPLSDFLINRQYISKSTARKLFNTIGHWGPMVSLIILGFITDETAAIALLILGVGLNAGTNAGFLLNHMDISPNFSGTLYGLTNFVSNFMSILGPMFVGFIVTDPTDPALWRIVFLVAAGFYFIGNLIFIIWGRVTIQHWNSGKQ